MEKWDLVYLSIFHCFTNESGTKDMVELAGLSSIGPDEESMADFLGDLIRACLGKKASLSPSASCRAYQFADSSKGQDDKTICDQLLNAVSHNVFRSHAEIIAAKYIKTPKVRDGILFVLNANVTTKKQTFPSMFVFKTDYIPAGIMDNDGHFEQRKDILLPELKKSIVYPHFDGSNFQFEQIRLFQKSSADYFQSIFDVENLPDANEIADKALKEELDEKDPGKYDRYFELDEQERRKKRDVFGEARLIQNDDLMTTDEVAHLTMKTQMKNMDKNSKPIRLRLMIDDGLRFEGQVDQLNKTFFFARNGLEKVLIVRGNSFHTKSHFQSVEFMKLDSVEDVMHRMGSEPIPAPEAASELEIYVANQQQDDDEYDVYPVENEDYGNEG
jgi:hypothetical protein